MIFQNNDDKKRLSKLTRLSLDNSTVIQGSGVNLSQYQVLPLPNRLPIVLLAARLLVDKGVREFVQAAELVNKNLLVSNTATAITEPQLDIHTKEIACSHGCTVSNIDEKQLYFLQSRGIETNMAEETLKQCFLTE